MPMRVFEHGGRTFGREEFGDHRWGLIQATEGIPADVQMVPEPNGDIGVYRDGVLVRTIPGGELGGVTNLASFLTGIL